MEYVVLGQDPGDPLLALQTWPKLLPRIEQKACWGMASSVPFCNKACNLWKTTHSLLFPPWPEARMSLNLSICQSNKALRFLCLEQYCCFKAKRTGTGHRCGFCSYFIFNFKGENLSKTWWTLCFLKTWVGGAFVCSWEPPKHALLEAFPRPRLL